MELKFKKEFIEKYSRLTDFDSYKNSVSNFPRKSIRVNILKISVDEVRNYLERQGWRLEQVPWCNEGFYYSHDERRDIGNLDWHWKGYFFVQSSVSMIPAIVLDPKPGEIVLDLCAAPGAKTTQIAAIMKNKGIIFANDFDDMRLKILTGNLIRCGVANSIVTNFLGEEFSGVNFDKILLDAPCTGSGLIIGKTKRSLETLKIWNQKKILMMAERQKRLLLNAFDLLKENGVLVYSTCSLEPEENEDVVNYLINKRDNAKLEKIKINGMKETEFLRIWPQDFQTEGFFIARIRK